MKLFYTVLVFIVGLIFGQEFQILSGDIIQLGVEDFRTCPDLVDSCIYVCGDGENNPCHPENLFSIGVDSSTGDTVTEGSRFRIHFPWEYEGETANKFVVRASWPCLSPTAVFASGNYAYWDVIGHDACPGTVQGSVWYGSDCQDEDGNIGSPECMELVGRFCFAPGDTLDWPEESDQSISTDVCDACWMSSPTWDSYDEGLYSNVELSPAECDVYDHCHHSEADSVLCGVGYLDGESVSISDEIVPYVFDLKPSYPNPFNPSTTIRFNIPSEIQHAVSLQVYDISGRMVETLVNEKLEPGQYDIQWNAAQHSSGVYFLKMNSGSFTKTQKLILLK
ncbi:T9SS type A sorting domain-containing protein [bacterium]|nr:T9SS type A sorting domain-containing protein [bacterium]